MEIIAQGDSLEEILTGILSDHSTCLLRVPQELARSSVSIMAGMITGCNIVEDVLGKARWSGQLLKVDCGTF